MGRGRWRGGQWEGGDGEGAAKGETGKLAKGRGRRRGKRRGDFTYEMLGWTYGMPGRNEVTDLTLFTRATPGTPASNDNKVQSD